MTATVPSWTDFITLAQAAEKFPFAYSTLAQYAREGKIKVWYFGKVRVTTKACIRDAISEGRIGSKKRQLLESS